MTEVTFSPRSVAGYRARRRTVAPMGPLGEPRSTRRTPVRHVLLVALVSALTLVGCASGAPPKGASPPAGATDTPDPPAFTVEVSPVTAADLGQSWRPGCPVGPTELRRLRLSHWGFDDRPHLGELVVHESVVPDVATVFRVLYDARFPIRRIQPVDRYGGSDDRSMADDNTSGFNCRNAVNGGPAKWSAHAYGKAIDVNPLENPYLLNGDVLPPAGRAYADRATYRPGMAVPGGALVKAFAAAGWSWGGRWSDPDYQHFSSGGG
jgi:hypothetical protein